MQWKTGPIKKEPSMEEEQDELKRWHIYFTWKPRQLLTGNTAWLERIACRVTKFKYSMVSNDVETWEYTSRMEAATDVFKAMQE